MSYYEESLKKAELNCKYVEAGFAGTVEEVASEIKQGVDMERIIRKLRWACDVMEDALEDADRAFERVQEERERNETLRIEA